MCSARSTFRSAPRALLRLARRAPGSPPARFAPVIARARVVLEALEKGEREGGATQKTLIDDLPLFAASPPPQPAPAKTSAGEEKLAEIIPLRK